MAKLSVEEALALIRAAVRPLGTEMVAANDSLGRITASSCIAERNVPGFEAAAMDGYALRRGDLCPSGIPLMKGETAAGTAPPSLSPGMAMAISTGAPVPLDADLVLPRERAAIDRGMLRQTAESGANIRAVGEDFAVGTTVLAAGIAITPDMIGALSACGIEQVTARRRPTMTLISTGSELCAGSGFAGIADSNAPMIAAAAAALNVRVKQVGPVPDDASALDDAFDRATGDIIVSTGGVSGGAHDLVRAALERRGARIMFHGLAMRPGKPILFAILPDGRPFFGLPGNPVAALVGFRFFVSAAIRGMLGLPPELGQAVQSDEPGREGTTLFLRARRLDGAIDTSLDQRSHMLSSVIAADCWLKVTQDGNRVEHRLFEKTASLG